MSFRDWSFGPCRNDEKVNLADALPGLSAAEHAAERAALDLQRIQSFHGDGGVVIPAAVGIVNPAGPFRADGFMPIRIFSPVFSAYPQRFSPHGSTRTCPAHIRFCDAHHKTMENGPIPIGGDSHPGLLAKADARPDCCGRALLEHPEHDRADKGEGEIGGHYAEFVDESHGKPPRFTSLPALTPTGNGCSR